MSVYANVYLCKCIRQINIHKSEVHCRSVFEPGGSGLPYYCTPPVCVPAVLGALAVWRFSKKKRLNATLIPSPCVCCSYILRVCGYVFCLFNSSPLLFVYLRLRIFSNPRSIAGVPFDSAGRFQATLILRNTSMYAFLLYLDCYLCGGITT